MKFKLLILLLFSALLADAQSMFWATSTNNQDTYSARRSLGFNSYEDITDDQVQTFSLNPLSYYVGGGATFQLNDSPSFEDRFSVNADLILNPFRPIAIGKSFLNIATRGNIQGFIFGQSPDVGLEAGIYPFLQVAEKRVGYDLIVHGGFEGRILPRTEGFSESDRSYRVFLGLETSIYISENSKPIVLGATPVFERNINLIETEGANSDNWGIEGNLIFQVVEGFGLLVRAYGSFDGDRPSGVQTGIVLIGANKGR